MFQSDQESMSPLARRQKMTMLLQDTIVMFCKNMIKYDLELSVEGLLGVTVDRRDIVLINIKELVTSATNQEPLPNLASDDDLSEMPTLTKRKRPRLDRSLNSTTRNRENILATNREQFNVDVGLIGGVVQNALVSDALESIIEIDDDSSQTLKQENAEQILNRRGSTKDSERILLLPNDTDGDLNNFSSRHSARRSPSRREHRTRARNRTDNDVVDEEIVDQGYVKYEHDAVKEELDNGDADLIEVTQKLTRRNTSRSCADFNLAQSASWVTFNPEQTLMDQSFSLGSVDGLDPSDLDSICGTARDMSGAVFYQCVICPQTFTAKHHARRHYNSQHSCTPEHYFCELCGAGFKRLDVMKRHAKSVHRDADCSDWLNLDNGSSSKQSAVIQ